MVLKQGRTAPQLVMALELAEQYYSRYWVDMGDIKAVTAAISLYR